MQHTQALKVRNLKREFAQEVGAHVELRQARQLESDLRLELVETVLAARRVFCVSILTFVLVKQVNGEVKPGRARGCRGS